MEKEVNSEAHHFLKIDQRVDKCLVALLRERHIWKKSETVYAARFIRQ